MSKPKRRSKLTISAEEKFERDMIFFNNPIAVHGLALTPIIAVANTIKKSAILMLVFILLLLTTRILASFFITFIPSRLKTMFSALLSGIVLIPVLILASRIFGEETFKLGIYLPMLAVDTLIISSSEIKEDEKKTKIFIDAIKLSLGYALVVYLVGFVRELVGSGSILGYKVFNFAILPIANTTAGGFIITGILLAVFQSSIFAKKRVIIGERRQRKDV
jgi:electron transport complex protein RnfE